jgi:hypothetical protein
MTIPFRYNPAGEAAPVTDSPRVAPLGETETRVRECRCGRDGVTDYGQCAARDGWGALRPGTYCRRGAEQ